MSIYKNNELLQTALDDGIIDMSIIEGQLLKKQREKYLNKHTGKIWLGKNGKYYTYFPGRKLVKRNTREAIEDAIVDYYSKEGESKPTTFNDFYWLWRNFQDQMVDSENTPVKYESDYNRYFKDTDFVQIPIANIREDDIRLFIRGTIKRLKLSKQPAKSLFGYINRVIKYARRNGYIENNPTEFLQPKDFYQYCFDSKQAQKQQTIDDDDRSLILQQLQEDHVKKPNYIPSYAIELAFLTGMRVGEIAALRWDNITQESIIIDSSEKFNRKTNEYYIDKTKNKKIREFPLTPDISNLLEAIKKVEIKYGYVCEWIFADQNGRVHSLVISSCMKNKCRQLGIEERGIHAIRKTVNSEMRCSGVSSAVAASLLGHTEEVNMKYYTFDVTTQDEKKKIIEDVNQKMLV